MKKDDFGITAMSNLNKNKQAAQSLISGKNVEQEPKEKKETRTKRTNLVITPTLYNDLIDLSKIYGTNFNNMVNIIMQRFVAENENELENYRKIKQKL